MEGLIPVLGRSIVRVMGKVNIKVMLKVNVGVKVKTRVTCLNSACVKNLGIIRALVIYARKNSKSISMSQSQ